MPYTHSGEGERDGSGSVVFRGDIEVLRGLRARREAPRKAALTLYGLLSYEDVPARLDALGTFTRGKGCLYVKRLGDIDLGVLRELVEDAYATRGASGGA